MSLAQPAAEIRDPVHGYIYLTEVEREVIDTPVFQRLRRIKQLAGAHLTYPGGQHSRFEHAIGSMYLAGRAAQNLREKGCLDVEWVEEMRLASLLHDVGHGPFSHLIEEVMTEKRGVTHEDVTRRVLRETPLRDVMEGHGVDSSRLTELAVGGSPEAPRFVNDVLGGGLSVDVMDYLLRDAYFTGVEYGKVDVHRVINSFEVVEGRLALNQAALYAFEALMVARYSMFRAVYFHRTVRAAEVMLIRAIDLADDELGLTDTGDLERYLSLTDDVTLALITDLETGGRRELEEAKRLAEDYRDRRLWKCVFERLVHRKDRFMERIFSQKSIRQELAARIADQAGVEVEGVYVDVPTAPSVPYTSEREALSTITLVSDTPLGRTHHTVRIEELPLLGGITGYMDLLRVYSPPQYRLKVEEAANRFFGREGYTTRISM